MRCLPLLRRFFSCSHELVNRIILEAPLNLSRKVHAGKEMKITEIEKTVRFGRLECDEAFFQIYIQGYTLGETADILGMTRATAREKRQAVFDKLGVTDQKELIEHYRFFSSACE